MATSNSIDFNPTTQEIVTRALEIVGAYDPEDAAPDAGSMTTARFHLNAMIKAWGRRGPHMWAQDDATLFLTVGQSQYDLGSGSTDYATAAYVQTTLSAAEASGQTIISVTSEAGMTAADNIAIRLDDGTLHWSTISSLGTLTIANALPSDAASGALVYVFTTALRRPHRIFDMRRRAMADDTEVPLRLVGRQEYMSQTLKASTGQPVMAYYEPSLTAGKLYVWPAPDSTATTLRFTAERTLEDTDSVANTLELPPEWIEPAVWSLAGRLAIPFGVPEQRTVLIQQTAATFFDDALNDDQDTASVWFAPGVR